MNVNEISVYKIVSEFNHGEMRKKMIPSNLVSGWPCIQKVGKTLCIMIPYYSRTMTEDQVALYPLYCSVTFPIGNPDRLMDFTIYPYQKGWEDMDYSKPVGYFKHEALADVKTKGEYKELCMKLFGYYDQMVKAIFNRKPFENEDAMIELFTKLMEPGQYPQYLKLNNKFYSYFCRLS